MQNAAEPIHAPDGTSKEHELLAQQVDIALYEILKSVPFRGSKQCQQLLQYVVHQSLEGRLELLKERIIGAEVFGRAVDYDTNVDPIVRTRAVEVRKRLAQYYVSEGKNNPVRIEFTRGSYHTSFLDVRKSISDEPVSAENLPTHYRAQPEAITESETSVESPHAARADRVHPRTLFRIVGIVLVLAVAGVVAYISRPKDPVRLFWSPLLENSKPVLIYTGASQVYLPSNQLIERFKSTHHLTNFDPGGSEFLVPLSEDQPLEPTDFLEVRNGFESLGDVSANVSVSSLLNRFNHSFDVRSGEDIVFADLRDSPAILIGAFNNVWTLQMTDDLPFVFASGRTILERSGGRRQWHPVLSSANKTVVDYALVSRLPHSKTGGALVTIAGITQTGTRAAAEFITSRDGINLLLKSVPGGFGSMNLEFVLETKIVGDIPTTYTVVAARAW